MLGNSIFDFTQQMPSISTKLLVDSARHKIFCKDMLDGRTKAKAMPQHTGVNINSTTRQTYLV